MFHWEPEGCYHQTLHSDNNNNNNNNNIFFFKIALFLLRSERFTVYYYPGHRIQNQFCTQSALSPLPGEHSGQSPFDRRTHANTPQYRPHPIPGPHLHTWVESSNVDKVSCWRTKVPGHSANRTRALSVRVEGPHHYTTAPPHDSGVAPFWFSTEHE